MAIFTDWLRQQMRQKRLNCCTLARRSGLTATKIRLAAEQNVIPSKFAVRHLARYFGIDETTALQWAAEQKTVKPPVASDDTQRPKEGDLSVSRLDRCKDSASAPTVPVPPIPPNVTPPPPVKNSPPASSNPPVPAPTVVGKIGYSHDVSVKEPHASSSSSSAQSPKSEQPPNPSRGKAKDDDSDTFSFHDGLIKAFNRDGVTSLDDDELESHDAADVVKDPAGRGRKLKANYQEAIGNEPPPEERRRDTERSLLEGPNEAVRQDLLEWYHGKCQICGKTWRERNGRLYFTAAYLVERHHARWIDNPGNAICLCAEHFAQWRHAAIETPENVIDQIQRLRLAREGGDGKLTIRFRMLKDEQTITYNERHLLALRTLLEVASEAGR